MAGVRPADRRDPRRARAHRDPCPPRQPRGPRGRARAPGPRRAEPGGAGAARPGEARPPPAGRQRDHPDSAAGAGERPAVAMAKPAVRLEFVERGVFIALALLVVRAAQVQLLEGRRWAEAAQAQRTERIVLQARRGTLSDRHGTPIALTQETYHIGVAPNELRDPPRDGPLIVRQLRLTAGDWQRALRRKYAYFQGPYSVIEIQPLRAVRGVHLEPVLNRFYPSPDFARAVIGRVGSEGGTGLERTLDSLLAG